MKHFKMILITAGLLFLSACGSDKDDNNTAINPIATNTNGQIITQCGATVNTQLNSNPCSCIPNSFFDIQTGQCVAGQTGIGTFPGFPGQNGQFPQQGGQQDINFVLNECENAAYTQGFFPGQFDQNIFAECAYYWGYDPNQLLSYLGGF